MKVKELLERVSPDTRDRVQEVQRRHLEALRAALRAECRLQLRRGSESDASAEAARLSLNTTIGYPEWLADLEIPEAKRLAALLAPLAPHLRALATSAPKVQEGLVNLLREGDLLDAVIPEARTELPAIAATERLARRLLAHVESFDLVAHVLAVNEDVLGRYLARSNTYGEVHLYWGVIGLIAPALDVSIEALAAVVLAHELAHGYTHLGFDIEGRQWDLEAFGQAEPALVEGLAQYYTRRMLVVVGSRVPDALRAYELLKVKQPPQYRADAEWETKATPEAVRAALVAGRQRGVTTHSEFSSEVLECAQRLRGRA